VSLPARELERFRNIQRLHDHWSRPAGRRSYYWYVTFERSAQLHALVAECQRAVAFPYYDLVPMYGLHLTLDRIAFDGDITPDQLYAIETAARRACLEIPSFDITIGDLGGTRGAIGFTAFPARPMSDLRSALRKATVTQYPHAPVRNSDLHPHVTIAYANSDDIPAAEIIAVVERLNTAAHVDITICDVALVLLDRHSRSYTWQALSRMPLHRNGET
jgi:2'-5' RNA ligase